MIVKSPAHERFSRYSNLNTLCNRTKTTAVVYNIIIYINIKFVIVLICFKFYPPYTIV